MITNAFIIMLTILLNGIFEYLPTITKLPEILGVDIDGQLVYGVQLINSIIPAFWVIGDVFKGAFVLLLYYAGKMLLRLLLGNRAPAAHAH